MDLLANPRFKCSASIFKVWVMNVMDSEKSITLITGPSVNLGLYFFARPFLSHRSEHLDFGKPWTVLKYQTLRERNSFFSL